MADNYRITIRTTEDTADILRSMAYDENLTLHEMLRKMIDVWQCQTESEELDPDALAHQYTNGGE